MGKKAKWSIGRRGRSSSIVAIVGVTRGEARQQGGRGAHRAGAEARPRRVGDGERPGAAADQGRRRVRHQRQDRQARREGRPDGHAGPVPAPDRSAAAAGGRRARARRRSRRRSAQLAQAQANLDPGAAAATSARRRSRRRIRTLISDEQVEQLAHGGRREQGARRGGEARGRSGHGRRCDDAQSALGKTTIYAPMAGRVTRLNVEQGETAIPGTFNKDAATLLTISDMRVLETQGEGRRDRRRAHQGRRLGRQSRSTRSPTRPSSAA